MDVGVCVCMRECILFVCFGVAKMGGAVRGGGGGGSGGRVREEGEREGERETSERQGG